MDICDQLFTPMDSISSGHLTLGIYPMFIAIGQLLSDRSLLFYPANCYIKIYVDDFLELASLYLQISQLLFSETESIQKIPFASINSWQVVKDLDKYCCIFQNQTNYLIKFDLFQFTELFEKFKDILFKPLCLPPIYSLHLKKFSLFLSQNSTLYPAESIDQFTFEVIENLLTPMFENQNFDKSYLVELIMRYKDIILAFLKTSSVLLPTQFLDSSQSIPDAEPLKKVTQLKQLTLFEQAAKRKK